MREQLNMRRPTNTSRSSTPAVEGDQEMRPFVKSTATGDLHTEIEPDIEIPLGSPIGGASSIPVGHWRDGLWDLFQYGLFHTTVWVSCCCVAIAAGQLITRLRLTFWGHSTTTSTGFVSVFKLLATISVSFWIIRIVLLISIAVLDPNWDFDETKIWIEPGWAYHILVFVDDILAYLYMGFTAVLLRNIRLTMRRKYNIPAGDYCPGGCDDACCSLCCPCFVAGQMLRHTADYDTYPGRCCTDTGLPPNAPTIV